MAAAPGTRAHAPSADTTREAGFSLLELMIALVIMAVITSQMFVMLAAQQRGFRGESRALDLQETTRLVLDLIAFDARNAGMLIPRQAAIASSDGGAAADRLCVSDGSVFPIPGPGVSDTFWDNLGDRFPGAKIADAGASSTTDLIIDSSDIDKQGTLNDFTAGSGVIVARADGLGAHCARITAAPAGQVQLDAPMPFATGDDLIIVPAIIYEVVGNSVQRNGIPISPNIEDLQVEYWVDASGTPNGVQEATEWPIDRLDTGGLRGGGAGSTLWMDTSRIRRVTISVVGISATPDEGVNGSKEARHRYPGVANRPQGAAVDRFPRKVFTASVLPRNLLNPGEVPNVP